MLMGKELSERQLYVLMGGMSLLLFMVLGAIEVVFDGLFWGVIGCSVYAICHETNTSLTYDHRRMFPRSLTGLLHFLQKSSN